MSYYYNYTLGYQTEDGKIYPLGPFDYKGKLKDVLSKSHSFASDLYEMFYPIKDEQYSYEFKKQFSYTDYEGNVNYRNVRFLPLAELPSDNYIKSGYYLIDDIDRYTRSLTDEDVYFEDFYTYLTPETYLRMVENELKFGIRTNSDDDESTNYTCADYAYFCYPDYKSKEYECAVIKMAANMFETYELPKGSKIVVLETEG